MVRVDLTVQRFPGTGPLKEACGIPLSCVVQPCSGSNRTPAGAMGMLSSLARCKHCYAYINHLCELADSSFTCSICGRSTELKHLTLWHSQYCRYPAARQHLPELTQQVYEVMVDPDLQGTGMFGQMQQPQLQHQQAGPIAGGGEAFAGQPRAVPASLMLVDTAGPDEFNDLVRAGLSVAVEALDPASLVGFIGVSDSISILDLSGAGSPMLHHVPVLEAAPLLVALEDVVPLSSMLVPVAAAKQRLTQVLDALLPDTPSSTANSSSSRGLQEPSMDRRMPGTTPATGAAGVAAPASGSSSGSTVPQHQHAVGGVGGKTPPCRAVGPALQAVLEYLRGLHAPHEEGPAAGSSGPGPTSPRNDSNSSSATTQSSGVAQVVLFLSGPPDIAYGKTVAATAAGRPGGSAGADGTVSPSSGDLSRQMAGLQLHYPVQDPKSKAFYEQAAVAAASMGIVVDVYAAARGYIGLQTLEPLVNSTGGVLFLYPSAEEATLPQDLYRRLSAAKARSGMLRLRTSPQVKVIRSYGRLYQDQRYSDLFHVPCCDSGQAFVFDFEHVGSGVYDSRFQQVTLQVAFQYSQVVAVGAAPDAAGTVASTNRAETAAGAAPLHNSSSSSLAALASGTASRTFVVQRLLRVCTLRLPVALGPAEVYSSVDADTVLTVLTHKITKAVRTQSVAEARLLLRDWLVIFTANYHRNSFMRASAEQLVQLPVDLTFSSCPPLQPIPRLVYALLRSPLLSSAAQYHSDLTAYLHHLWCCLPPRELAKAVYPGLKAFADPETLIAEGLPLSRSSLQGPQLAEAAAAAAREVVASASAASQAAAAAQGQPSTQAAAAPQPGAAAAAEYSQQAQAALAVGQAVAEGKQSANILLLDAFILVLVVYRAGAPADLPFPPPQQSKLWQMVQDIKRDRRVTTHVEVVREGGDAANLFYSLLIDDPDDMADTPITQTGQQAKEEAPPGGKPIETAAAAAGYAAAPAAGPSPTGVAQFIQHIKAEVFHQLQPQH